MTAQPLWRSNRHRTGRGSPFGSEVGVRFGDELEIENVGPDGASITIVIGRAEVAELAAKLFEWLRVSPAGRMGAIVDPRQAADVERELSHAYELTCERDGCRHPLKFHGVGTQAGRPTPCLSCLCPAFR